MAVAFSLFVVIDELFELITFDGSEFFTRDPEWILFPPIAWRTPLAGC
jgi:hypothetical protein